MSTINCEKILKSLPLNYYVIDANTLKITETNDPKVINSTDYCYKTIFGFDSPCNTVQSDFRCLVKQVVKEKTKIELTQSFEEYPHLGILRMVANPITNDQEKVNKVIVHYEQIYNWLKFEENYKGVKEINRLIEKVKLETNSILSKNSISERKDSFKNGYFIPDYEGATKFRTLSEYSPVAIMMYQNNKWIHVNPMGEKITGYSEKELLTMNFWEIAHPDYKEEVKKRGKARQKGQNIPHHYDIKIITKSKKEKWVSVYGSCIEYNGKTAAIVSVLDINDIKTIELALKDSQRKLRSVTENSTNLFFQHKTDYTITYLSPQSKDILGYWPEEVSVDFTKLFTDNPINKTGLEITEKAIKTGQEQRPYELELWHKSGHKIWVEIREAPIVEKGKTIAIVGAIVDITEKKKAIEALKDSEERYRKLFESANVGIGISTTGGRILAANKAITEILEYTHKELLNIDIIDLYANSKERAKILEEITQEGEVRNRQIRMRTKNGKTLWVLISAQKLRSKDGKRMIFVISDITKERQNELKLFEQEKKFRTYIESSPVAIVIIDKEGKFKYVNRAVSSLLGYEPEEVYNMSILDIKIATNQKDKLEDFNDLIKNGFLSGREVCYRNKNGRIINIIIDAIKLSEKEYIAFCTDVSELKAIEKELKETNEEYLALNEEMEDFIIQLQNLNSELKESKEKAEESDRLKSAFLANMSHELRTPLNGILGFSTLMRRSNLTKESMTNYAKIIENSGHRLLNVVNDLFDISLIHSNQLKISKTNFNLNELLIEIETFYKTLHKDKLDSINFSLDINNNSEIILNNDKNRLFQIFKNLIDNAFKFTQTGDIEFGYTLEQNRIKFFVKDSGIGISKKDQKIIFSSFKQVDDSITRNYEGAGLGLAICAGILERMGGHIWVESEKDNGSQFYFELPIIEQQILQNKIKDNYFWKKQILKDKIILIVEDDSASYEYLKEFLEDIGGSGIIHTTMGEDAIRITKTNKVDLIFMDIRLPGIDGCKTTQLIREFDKKVRIIAQTAYTLDNNKKKLLEVGCNDYISKPISEENLTEIIKAHLVN